MTSCRGMRCSHAPARTADVIKTLNDALQEVSGDAEIKKKMLALGIEAKAGTPEAIEDRLKSDIDKWRAVIEKAHIPKQ